MAESKKKKSSGKKSESTKKEPFKFTSPVNDKNHFWSVVLFALGVLTFFMTFVKGSAGWLAIHNFLLGTFGFAVVFVPAILIYTSIQIGMEKSEKCVADRAIWGISLAFLTSAAIQIFAVGALPGKEFSGHIEELYKDGVKLNGGGVASYLIAGPLLGIFGGIGAKIITIMLFFVTGMLLTHKSLIEFLEFITRPFRNFGRVVQGLYSMLMGGDFSDIF
ncbi:MAG: DNA translocase FtsK 4TM domain-containing protein, partial [Ruminococcus sp.]|nr:DNA translocase FtsK 4TM domain-containing protein [Ruminococcus sp.]